jgi:hypothetical protein
VLACAEFSEPGELSELAGIVFYPRSTWLVAEFVLVFWLDYERIVVAEEASPQEQFDEQSRDRAGNMLALLLPLAQWKRPPLYISLRSVLERDYSAVLGITLGCFLPDTAAHGVR